MSFFKHPLNNGAELKHKHLALDTNGNLDAAPRVEERQNSFLLGHIYQHIF